jgi:hypothetical protein
MTNQAGKGDTPRPYNPTAFDAGWERVFGCKSPRNGNPGSETESASADTEHVASDPGGFFDNDSDSA